MKKKITVLFLLLTIAMSSIATLAIVSAENPALEVVKINQVGQSGGEYLLQIQFSQDNGQFFAGKIGEERSKILVNNKPINDSSFNNGVELVKGWMGGGKYELRISKNIEPTILDVSKEVTVKILSGYSIYDTNGNVINTTNKDFTATLFLPLKVENLESYIAGGESVIKIGFNYTDGQNQGGASWQQIMADQRSNILVNGKPVNSPDYFVDGNEKVSGWWGNGKYELHIKRDTAKEILDVNKLTIKVNKGFYIINAAWEKTETMALDYTEEVNLATEVKSVEQFYVSSNIFGIRIKFDKLGRFNAAHTGVLRGFVAINNTKISDASMSNVNAYFNNGEGYYDIYIDNTQNYPFTFNENIKVKVITGFSLVKEDGTILYEVINDSEHEIRALEKDMGVSSVSNVIANGVNSQGAGPNDFQINIKFNLSNKNKWDDASNYKQKVMLNDKSVRACQAPIAQENYVDMWYDDATSELQIHINPNTPQDIVDLSKPIKVKVLSGFIGYDEKGIILGSMKEDSIEYVLTPITVKTVSSMLGQNSSDYIINIEFSIDGVETKTGEILGAYQRKILINDKAINDSSYANKIAAWYTDGVYGIYIKKDIDRNVLNIFQNLSLKVLAGFRMVDAADNIIGCSTANSSVYTIEGEPEPIIVEKHLTDLNIVNISNFDNTSYENNITIQFDREVCYNQFRHINAPAVWLEEISKQDTSPFYYNASDLKFIQINGIQESVNDSIVFDGETIAELNQKDDKMLFNSIMVHYGMNKGLQLSFNKSGVNKVDLTKEHILTMKAGFITPLGGVIKEDITFTYSPSLKRWAKNA